MKLKTLALAFALAIIPGLSNAQMTTLPGIHNLPIGFPTDIANTGGITLNAVGDHLQLIGTVFCTAGSGNRTISAAGTGSITVNTDTVTWATASSEIRVGLEDVDATGFGDGTQDVYGAKIAGTDTITSGININFDMTSGTKTLACGLDNVSLSFRMPVRAGADSLVFAVLQRNAAITTSRLESGRPYGINGASGGAGVKATDLPLAFIIFDDGTFGYILGTNLTFMFSSSIISLATNTTPDEIVAGFTVSSPIQICALDWAVDTTASGDNYELILYRDPFGTPSVVEAVAVTAAADTLTGTTAVNVMRRLTTPRTLTPGTVWGVGFRPTTTGAIDTFYLDLTTGFTNLKNWISFFSNVKLGSRVDQTGAFTEIQTYYVPNASVELCGLPNGGASFSSY